MKLEKHMDLLVGSINGLASYRPVLRRQLQPSWDFACAWVREEHPSHRHRII